MDEKDLEQLFQLDFSKGTEEFRDELLDRCLAEIRKHGEGQVIDDEELDMLAAAGNPFAGFQVDPFEGLSEDRPGLS